MAVTFTQLTPLVLVDLGFTSFLERTHTVLSVFSVSPFRLFTSRSREEKRWWRLGVV